jgi:ectoine hydroxylase-related dioxygenase (phytanoyl-CoA dioxygenase family)
MIINNRNKPITGDQAMLVSPENIAQFRKEGYFILEGVIPAPALEGLRAECQRYIDKFDAEMEAKGLNILGINHYKKRYFISNRGNESPIITQFLFGDLMDEITHATLGETVYLFNEQYVVKAADKDTKFGWHQDSGYIGHYHKPYLSCWCALDDMSVANGTISVLPYERAGMQPDDLFEHVVEEGTNDKVGYHGSDPGIPVIVPAGSIVAFSSRTFHRSGPNQTDKMRRSYLAQYSKEPIMTKDNTKIWAQAVLFEKKAQAESA